VKPAFRVIDTGVREGRLNIAFDQALIDLHRRGETPDSIRFLQFQPSALVGRHQALMREINVRYCRDNGIRLVRRITGGGALYMDEGQFGFELIFHKRTLGYATLGDLSKIICEAAAQGLSKLGVDARFRPRNDIEVRGRKISGTGGFFDGDTIFFQGTVLVDMDAGKMLAALNTPEGKLAKRGLHLAENRIVTLRELLGAGTPPLDDIKAALLGSLCQGLRVDPCWGETTAQEENLARQIFSDEIGTDEFVDEIDERSRGAGFVSASTQGAGGAIDAHIRVDDRRINEVLITGDFFVTPPRTILDLEASLRGAPVDEVEARVESFFAKAPVEALSAEPRRFSEVIRAALSSSPNLPA